MYVALYNRLTGWLWFAIGLWSLFSPNIGDYIDIARPETYLSLGLGLIGMYGARGGRLRNQAIVCGTLTVVNLACLVLIGTPMADVIFSPTPLEGVFRFLCVLWGIYCLYNEIRLWTIRWKTSE